MMERVISRTITAAVLALLSNACAAAHAPQPAKPVDAGRFYTGVWAEIGRRPISLTDGCVAGATRYTSAGHGRVDVRDTCHKGVPSGREEAIGGPGRIIDPGANAKLRVSYRLFGIFPVDREYWVLDHADDYSWFISADPNFENLWIYTRDPKVAPATVKALVNRARTLGYDVTKLEVPVQP